MVLSRRIAPLRVVVLLALELLACRGDVSASDDGALINQTKSSSPKQPLDPLGLGAEDLGCSACTVFVETYLSKCHQYVFSSRLPKNVAVLEVYKKRIYALFKENKQEEMAEGSKRKKVEEVLERAKKQRRLHPLYLKLCKHFGIKEPQSLYKGLEALLKGKDRQSRKRFLAAEALKETLAGVEDGTQWAISGNEGERKYMDFQQAQSNSNGGSLSMGGDVEKQLKKAFTVLGANYSELLTFAVADVNRVYDSRLDKTFCVETVGACRGEVAETVPAGEGSETTVEEDIEEIDGDAVGDASGRDEL